MECEYDAAWREYKEDPEKYWTKLAEKLYWHKKWDKLYEMSAQHPMRWFVGGKLSVCYNCLDRPIEEGFGDKVILISESDLTQQTNTFTYNQLFHQVTRLSGALLSFGVKENDHVLINLPMITETLISIMAINRVGAVYATLLEGITNNALKRRIDEFQPKVIITTNVGISGGATIQIKLNLDSVLSSCRHQPVGCIVLQREVSGHEAAPLVKNRDISWNEAVTKFQPFLSCVPVDACQPFFMVYTSGSTGKPKAVVHAVGSFAVGLLKGDLESGGVVGDGPYWSSARFGWIGANLNVANGPFLVKTTIVIYETPSIMNLRNLFHVWSKHCVKHAYLTAPLMKYIVKEDPNGLIAKSSGPYEIKSFITAGSPLDRVTFEKFAKIFDVPVSSSYGQTETCLLTTLRVEANGNRIYDHPLSSCGLIIPGCNVKILRDDMTEAGVEEVGKIAIKLPTAPGVLVNIYNDYDFFRNTYYGTLPGYFDMKDDGYVDEKGYLHVTNRADDVYKVISDRFSLTAIENVMMQHPDVDDVVVVLNVLSDAINNYIPVGFYITNQGCIKSDEQIEKEILDLVQNEIHNVITFERLCRVQRFPVSPASSKVARASIQNLVRNYKDMKEPPQTEDSDVIHIWDVLRDNSN